MEFAEHLYAHYEKSLVDGLLSALQERPCHALLLNESLLSEAKLLSFYPHLEKHPFIPSSYLYRKEEYDLGKSLLHDIGAFYIMDPSSMAVAHFLAPKRGERLLDIAAAPGGKTIHASILMQNEGVILSNDLSYIRAKELSSNVERMGRRNIAVVSGDIAKQADAYESYFDAIILDAPCSGSAMFRKNKEAEKDWTYEKVLRCASKQKELLEAAIKMLAPGGRLVYSTCSFSYEEDEAIVLEALKNHPEIKILPVEEKGLYHHCDLPEAAHFFPHLLPGEGQFVALLSKSGEALPQKDKLAALPRKKAGLVAPYMDFAGDYLEKDGFLYCLTRPLKIHGVSLLRYGVKLGEAKDPFLPDFALARASSSKESLALEQKQAIAYLKGETFLCQRKNGVCPVSYLGINLGYAKIVNGLAKNHYPKGLRRDYSSFFSRG